MKFVFGFVLSVTLLTISTPPVWFSDIAPRSRIAYRTNNGVTGRKYFPTPMCGGIAVLDYDRDGRPDLFFSNGARLPGMQRTPEFRNCLLRNQGVGLFQDMTLPAGLAGDELPYSFGVAAGDYDNDGFPDIFICSSGRNTLYRNDGHGRFLDVTEASGLSAKPANVVSVGAAWLDYNNDGLPDLLVTNYTTWTTESDIRCASEGLEHYCSPTVYPSVSSNLYRNQGGGRFEDVTRESGIAAALGKGMGISVADFDGDGWPDIFIANDTERNFLFMNQRDGTFREQGLLHGVAYNDMGASVSGMGSDAKDYDNDGWIDILHNDLARQIFGLFHNERGRQFTYASPESNVSRLSRTLSGWSIGFIDYDNDGWLDIYSANGHVDDTATLSKQSDSMWHNTGARSFTDASDIMGPAFRTSGYQRGSAFADLNNDGWMDLIVTSLGEHPRLLMNNHRNSNHWLTLELIGVRSSRDAIGTRVKLVLGSGRVLYNHVAASVGFMSSSDKRVHFGLGSESTVREALITWPGGAEQRVTPAADRMTVVYERPASP